MDTTVITSEPPATATKTKKRKMSAAGRKAIAEAAKARWAAKKAANSAGTAGNVAAIPAPTQPVPPSPAVLKLQEQVVELVTARHQARSLLNQAHNAYLAAQSRFQAAEGELKGIEQEVQYRIGLIAQLENRQNITAPSFTDNVVNNPHFGGGAVFQMPAAGSITSEPARQPQPVKVNDTPFAVSSADDLRREVRGMM